MTAIRALLAVAGTATAVACSGHEPAPLHPRLAQLEQAFAVREQDPGRAAELFEEAGPGAVLEQVRLEAWLEALESGHATPDRWRELLECRLPDDLAARARLGLADALIEVGDVASGVALLEGMTDEARLDADEILVALGEGSWRVSAARRLAVLAPRRLRRVAPDLEERALADLTADEWLERAARWREAGWPRTAATELRARRWHGDVERRRVLALARAEVEAGSTSRALRILPSVRNSGTDALVLRATAYRARGWQRVPDGSARRSFADCLNVASRAVTSAGDGELQVDSLRLVLECGTESGDLDRALDAWWRLEAIGWRDTRRGWLGRRLGVALAQRGDADEVIDDLAGALPDHERCLRFWQAWVVDGRNRQLEQLSHASPADVYGIWARESLGAAPPAAPAPAPAEEPAQPPAAVRWLIDRDAADLAMGEWRRIVAARGATPREALAAATYTAGLGDNNDSIRWLRTAYPVLGTVEMWRAPSNAVRSYLPLPWPRELTTAAREAGIEPWLLAAVGRQESVMTAHARSPRGAIGVLQLLPDTARMHARALGFAGAPDLQDASVNLRLGARELARLVQRFGAIEPALAAYNGGETRVRRWSRRWPEERRFTEAIPVPETYNYVRRVRFLTEAYRLVYDDVWRMAP